MIRYGTEVLRYFLIQRLGLRSPIKSATKGCKCQFQYQIAPDKNIPF
jgi:hypothetical protein